MSRKAVFNWKITLFSVVFLGVFLKLGFWQLDRAAEKERLVQQRQSSAGREPALLEETGPAEVVSGLVVRLIGEYEDDHLFLLDNRVLKGKVGFEVLVPFRTGKDRLVLVNRGFVPMGRTRETLPGIPPLKRFGTATGRIYIEERSAFEPVMTAEDSRWPRIVQGSNPALLQDMLGESLYPYVVRLMPDDPNALPRYWPDTNMSPGKHRGYALQWFTMALVIIMAFLYFTFRSSDDG